MGIAERLAGLRERVDQACRAADRDPAEVRLMAVSKTKPADQVREAYGAGARLFGENKAQEAADKSAELAGLDIGWAMIGHLQRNKINLVTGFATEFHALDSIRLATGLDRRLQSEGRRLDVFVQVNSSAEDSKFGLPPAEVPAFYAELGSCDALRVRGLMTLAADSDDQQAVADCFARVRAVQESLRQAGHNCDELSMGMSNDFELAIAYGATTIRLGSALFGPR